MSISFSCFTMDIVIGSEFVNVFRHFILSPRYGFVYFSDEVNIQSIIEVSENDSVGLILMFFIYNLKSIFRCFFFFP